MRDLRSWEEPTISDGFDSNVQKMEESNHVKSNKVENVIENVVSIFLTLKVLTVRDDSWLSSISPYSGRSKSIGSPDTSKNDQRLASWLADFWLVKTLGPKGPRVLCDMADFLSVVSVVSNPHFDLHIFSTSNMDPNPQTWAILESLPPKFSVKRK